jgi:hypothetical protein
VARHQADHANAAPEAGQGRGRLPAFDDVPGSRRQHGDRAGPQYVDDIEPDMARDTSWQVGKSLWSFREFGQILADAAGAQTSKGRGTDR